MSLAKPFDCEGRCFSVCRLSILFCAVERKEKREERGHGGSKQPQGRPSVMENQSKKRKGRGVVIEGVLILGQNTCFLCFFDQWDGSITIMDLFSRFKVRTLYIIHKRSHCPFYMI